MQKLSRLRCGVCRPSCGEVLCVVEVWSSLVRLIIKWNGCNEGIQESLGKFDDQIGLETAGKITRKSWLGTSATFKTTTPTTPVSQTNKDFTTREACMIIYEFIMNILVEGNIWLTRMLPWHVLFASRNLSLVAIWWLTNSNLPFEAISIQLEFETHPYLQIALHLSESVSLGRTMCYD
jgi:hypothetical protein